MQPSLTQGAGPSVPLYAPSPNTRHLCSRTLQHSTHTHTDDISIQECFNTLIYIHTQHTTHTRTHTHTLAYTHTHTHTDCAELTECYMHSLKYLDFDFSVCCLYAV